MARVACCTGLAPRVKKGQRTLVRPRACSSSTQPVSWMCKRYIPVLQSTGDPSVTRPAPSSSPDSSFWGADCAVLSFPNTKKRWSASVCSRRDPWRSFPGRTFRRGKSERAREPAAGKHRLGYGYCSRYRRGQLKRRKGGRERESRHRPRRWDGVVKRSRFQARRAWGKRDSRCSVGNVLSAARKCLCG